MTEQERTSDPDEPTQEHQETPGDGDTESDPQTAEESAADAATRDADEGDSTATESSDEDTPTATAAEDGDAAEEHSGTDAGRDPSEESESAEEGGIGIDDDLDVADDVLAYVESADTAEIADEIATLRFEVETLEADVAEYEEQIEALQSKLKRKQADFENYKKRMKKRREEEKARATEDLVERLLDVRDNLVRALEQDEDTDIRDGVDSTLNQFDRVLEQENVEAIEPQPGEDVDPERHEVLVRMESDQPADTIAQVHRPGYEMAGKVIRPAQVAVSEGED